MFSLSIESSFRFPTAVMVAHAERIVIPASAFGDRPNSDTLRT